MRMAEREPADLGYVECHCTGTEVGDAIEISGLRQAYAAVDPDAEGHQGGVPSRSSSRSSEIL